MRPFSTLNSRVPLLKGGNYKLKKQLVLVSCQVEYTPILSGELAQ